MRSQGLVFHFRNQQKIFLQPLQGGKQCMAKVRVQFTFLSLMSLDKVLYSCSLTHPQPALYHDGGGLVTKSCPTLPTPRTVACQAPLSVGFSRQEYWNALPFPPPRDLLNPETKFKYQNLHLRNDYNNVSLLRSL